MVLVKVFDSSRKNVSRKDGDPLFPLHLQIETRLISPLQKRYGHLFHSSSFTLTIGSSKLDVPFISVFMFIFFIPIYFSYVAWPLNEGLSSALQQLVAWDDFAYISVLSLMKTPYHLLLQLRPFLLNCGMVVCYF